MFRSFWIIRLQLLSVAFVTNIPSLHSVSSTDKKIGKACWRDFVDFLNVLVLGHGSKISKMINLKYKRFILPKSFGIVVHNQWVLTALDLNMCVLSCHPSQCVQWRGACLVLPPPQWTSSSECTLAMIRYSRRIFVMRLWWDASKTQHIGFPFNIFPSPVTLGISTSGGFSFQKPPHVYNEISAATIQSERVTRLRNEVQLKHEQNYKEALVNIKEELKLMEGPDIKEHLQDQIRQWFIECR